MTRKHAWLIRLQKSFALFLCLLALLTLSSCVWPMDRSIRFTNPYDFPGSEWQSEDPFIYLRLNEDQQLEGYMLLESQRVEIRCGIAPTWPRFYLYKISVHDKIMDANYILDGTFKCTEQKLTLKIERDFYFGKQYQVIVLERVG